VLSSGEVQINAKGQGTVSTGDRYDLSPRELECALLVGDGLNNRAIASSMTVQEKTIQNTIRHIYQKLDFQDNPTFSRRVRLARWVWLRPN